MGSKLRDLTDIDDGSEGGSDETSDPPFSISEMFDACFPYYLSIGMSSDEYWNGDPMWVKAYREADKKRWHNKNYEMYLQGRYVYDAIMRLVPSLQMWKPKEPIEYMSEPYPLTRKEYEERIRREQKRKQDAMKAYIESFALAHKQKEESNDG